MRTPQRRPRGAVKPGFDWVRISPAAGRALVVDALAGDRDADAALHAISQCARRIEARADSAESVLCLCCPAEIRSPRGVDFVIVTSKTDAPADMLGVAAAICPACAAGDDSKRRVFAALTAVWPSMRLVADGPAAAQ